MEIGPPPARTKIGALACYDSQAMEKHALVNCCGVVKTASKTMCVPLFSIFDLYI